MPLKLQTIILSTRPGRVGVFVSNDLIDDSARVMLDELWRWAGALKAMRDGGAG